MTKKESMKRPRIPSPAPSPPVISPPATSLPPTSIPCASLPTTVSSSTGVDATPTSMAHEDYMLLNLDEGFEVMEDGDFEEDDDIEAENTFPLPPDGEQQPRMRRRKTTNIILPEKTERLLGEWLEFDVPFIYDKGDLRHKQKEHVERVWEEKAASLNPPLASQDLKTWFSSLRSRFGRLSKEESGKGSRKMTGREKWILSVFKFLKPHIVRHRKGRTLGIPMSAANLEHATTPMPATAAGPGPSPAPDTDDVYDLSASSQEDTSPAISKLVCRMKKRKSAGSLPVVMTQGTLEQVLESVQKVHHNPGGVMDVVEEPELKYWRTSLESMAKDCVGLPSSYNTALKMELLAVIHRFRNAQEEGVAKPGPDLMLHAHRNFGFPAPQPQPQAQQQHPPMATTVPGVQSQPVLYHGTPASTLPNPLVTQPKPALVTLPAHQASALQALLNMLSAATHPPTHLPHGASTTQ
ncbi:uncharacterized protein [Palaemon carinicauda]|uniref:uncharacterized protein n=1 Tax=Palaemon carinicauda TaxID=392227 RepID=UPI0035B5F90D